MPNTHTPMTYSTEIDKIVEEAYEVFMKAWDRDWFPNEYKEAGDFLREKLTTYTTSLLEKIEGEVQKLKKDGHGDTEEDAIIQDASNQTADDAVSIIRSYKKHE